jgi:hypothetical protein
MSGIQLALLGFRGVPPSVSAPDALGSGAGFGSCGVVTASTTATATGGVPGYTYLWEHISGDTPAINNPNIASPTWIGTACDGYPNESTWQVTVTDSVGSTGTATIDVILVWINLSY